MICGNVFCIVTIQNSQVLRKRFLTSKYRTTEYRRSEQFVGSRNISRYGQNCGQAEVLYTGQCQLVCVKCWCLKVRP